ncbi:MAG: hypothetical protein JGK30_32635 [Microcoleus sp. PH2017_40_RAT_O_B]|uniref:hypothetical protein n=1 Tax=unclassified Microcoleus TaxID=2642155 RepID=UPI001DB758BB|nr:MULTISPECIES: hypothetical protein [unclassified Microcoleus]MCC3576242.1 hypothetical protein [Microcoleus sp. PH2017_34_RAT_O_A]MCC3614080.1 hypothetical protein [Microcoleus sp. PH2017_40_RAT_O_B]
MTLSNDCPCGRSQLFTFETKEAITVDRKTLEKIYHFLVSCTDELDAIDSQQELIVVAKQYLSSKSDFSLERGIMFIDCWLGEPAERIGVAQSKIFQAHQTLESILRTEKAGVSHD